VTVKFQKIKKGNTFYTHTNKLMNQKTISLLILQTMITKFVLGLFHTVHIFTTYSISRMPNDDTISTLKRATTAS
jgi:predicted secreted protein